MTQNTERMPINNLNIEDFINKINETTIIDVRAPLEFHAGHIPGSVNIPLFDDEARAAVGTAYTKKSRYDAILTGLEKIGPNLQSIVKRAKQAAGCNNITLYCWRGGLRSESMAWLLDLAGFNVFRLNGGYKSYRKFIHDRFSKKANIFILGGLTGSGKTAILKELSNVGQQIIDLESLANHKGSVFGGIDMKIQPTTEQFENELFKTWNSLDLNKPVWIEDESEKIGSVFLPKPFYLQMIQSKIILVKIPLNTRIQHLVNEYSCHDRLLLKDAVEKIGKHLGGLKTKESIKALESGEFHKTAEIALNYYDKAYSKSIEKRKDQIYIKLNLDADNPAQNAKFVIDSVQPLL
jgi:tRNA 2-selenouridine synthase